MATKMFRLYPHGAGRAGRAAERENRPARMVRGMVEVGVRTIGRVENVAEFNDIIVKNVAAPPSGCAI